MELLLQSHAESGDGEKAGEGAASGPGGGTGAILNREDAISRMRLIAAYFRENEPHSPLSYSMQNLIRLSQLHLDRLLEEWIEDPNARERYMLMTGITPDGQVEE